MSEREPITAELRRECASSVQRAEVSVLSGEPVIETTLVIDGKVFDRICDAIDAVHAGLERENAELRERLAVLDNERGNMHDGWVRLPLDADGVPIRVGDEVVDELDESTDPRKVTGIYLADDGWWVYIGGMGRRPSRYRHHQATTVEDVLTKFGIDWEYEDNCEDRAALLAEYAAKLRLAGSDAE